MRRIKNRGTDAAARTFKEFHAREPNKAVHPLTGRQSSFPLNVRRPYLIEVGKAIRVYYDSDKWKEVGDVEGYYHNHGPEDGAHPFRDPNQIRLYAPACYFDSAEDIQTVSLPVEWPDALVPLGSCAGWVCESDDGHLLDGKCNNAVLVCSPFGHVDQSDENRVFLAVIDLDDSTLEAIMAGPELRVTDRGIEG